KETLLADNKEKDFKKKYFSFTDNLGLTMGSFTIYKYRLTSPFDFCDIFIAENLPNEKTNRINVQIRSLFLWEYGEKYSISMSFAYLKEFLKLYDLEVKNVCENRIDYCYHTNLIQNPQTYFKDEFLEPYLVTAFRKGNKYFDIKSQTHDDFVSCRKRTVFKYSYLLLGRRDSNNVIFRTYNKSKEVIEEGYKSFFIYRWFEEKLINMYDFTIYTNAYFTNQYETIEYVMAHFYCQFGKDENIKLQLEKLLSSKISRYQDIKKIVTSVLPYPTIVMNFEYQTMRKFYSSSHNLIDQLDYNKFFNDESDILQRLYKIVDNRKIFLDYLTSKQVCFKRIVPTGEDEKGIY
ncbi:MAG: hypothetical protein ACRC7N_13755, partial [Clostridium sp.]